MTTILLLSILIALAVVAIVTFIRAERKGETFKSALEGEVDLLKKRATVLEAKFDGGSIPK